jgi:hypothetical protein
MKKKKYSQNQLNALISMETQRDGSFFLNIYNYEIIKFFI